jgi:wyosine [tRNA(Phe)-imidazoG37] synthetase (radical SAM superfamily)
LNESRWEKIKRLHSKELRISVSIDAASKETYESIRRGARWETLVENMEMLSAMRRNGELTQLMVTFVVMKRNLHEMIPFIGQARSWHCDKIEFQRIFGSVSGTENIFDLENPKALEHLGKIIQAPAFENAAVNISSLEEYRGYEATSDRIQRYRSRMIRHHLRKFSGIPSRLLR